MTLNAVIKRIKTICLAHKQVRSMYVGLRTDALNERTAVYPTVLLIQSGGTISLTNKATEITFQMMVLDEVHQAEEAKSNELDVQSDMVSIAMDLMAQLSSEVFGDWRMSKDNTIELGFEQENDMLAGVSMNFSIRTLFTGATCDVPSTADLEAIAAD